MKDDWPGRNRSQGPRNILRVAVNLAWMLLFLWAPRQLRGAELKPETVRAFDQYVQQAELRMRDELKSGRSLLWIDGLPDADRADAYTLLRNGGIIVHPVAPGLDIPGGMIHDWIGLVFIPNATLDETVAQIQNYNSYAQIYSPEVTRSKILRRNGDDFNISIRLEKKIVRTVALDVLEDIEYVHLGSSCEYSSAHSIQVVEVGNSENPPEHRDLAAAGHGYMWKLDAYGWFVQTPQGVYMQFETIALSRDIPWGLGWLVKPFVTKVPRESLMFTLTRARASLEAAGEKVAGNVPPPQP